MRPLIAIAGGVGEMGSHYADVMHDAKFTPLITDIDIEGGRKLRTLQES